MKKIIVALAALSFLVPDVASAEQLTTDFAVFVVVGKQTLRQPIPKTVEYYITLPSAFSDWTCHISKELLSPDGKSVYHNIVCANTQFNIAAEASCALGSESAAIDSFRLQSNTADGYPSVVFFVACDTHTVGTIPPPAGTKL